MKRILFAVAIALMALPAFSNPADRDVLITAEGTVYSIDSERSESGLSATLTLTIQSDGKTTRSVLPDSMGSALNVQPTLVYDAESKTLFVLWQRIVRVRLSELMIAAYQRDAWRPAVSVDYKMSPRYNLSAAITHRIQGVQRDGSMLNVPKLVLHAIWWEQDGDDGGARYAVMSLSGGMVSEIDIHSMSEFLTQDDSAVSPVDEKNFNRDLLRHVALLDGPSDDAVDALFADSRTNTFHRTTLRPISDGRLHIPGGVRGGEPRFGAPRAFSNDWSGRTATVISKDGSRMILINTRPDKVTYLTVTVADGKWSAPKEVAVDDKVTAESVIAALAKMVSSAQ